MAYKDVMMLDDHEIIECFKVCLHVMLGAQLNILVMYLRTGENTDTPASDNQQ